MISINILLSIPSEQSMVKNISFSFSGGLTKHLENEDFNATLARADSLVYKAKSLGRKQIIFA